METVSNVDIAEVAIHATEQHDDVIMAVKISGSEIHADVCNFRLIESISFPSS